VLEVADRISGALCSVKLPHTGPGGEHNFESSSTGTQAAPFTSEMLNNNNKK
jgi:hypothetical protein